MKVGFLFFGMFFYLLAVVVEEVNQVDDALLETAYTLGAKLRHALWLLFRASFPAIFGSFRILYDIGWTYVILAEMVNARKGVGYMVEAARKVLDFERVYAGIIAIGVAAFLFRWLLTVARETGCSPGSAPARPQPEPRRPLPAPWIKKLRSRSGTSGRTFTGADGRAGRGAARRQPRSRGRVLVRRPRPRRVPRAAGTFGLRQVDDPAA